MHANYPPTRTVEQVDTYHGVVVRDPYRWLEDLESEETAAWVAAQNDVTFEFLAGIPKRDRVRQRLTELWNYEKFSAPFKAGDRYFYFKNDGLQNQSVLYALDRLDGEPRVLLDPNTLSADGTVALSGVAVSDDGNLLAYGLSKSGSDWQEWFVRDVGTGEDRGDRLEWIKFSGAHWTTDNRGFFYSRYEAPDASKQFQEVNYFQKLYYHQLGADQADDELIYERPDRKAWMFGIKVSEDGRYLIISVVQGTDPRNLIFYKDLQAPNADIIELISEFEASYRFVGNDGPRLWFQTDRDSPRGRLIEIDLDRPAVSDWTELIPESDDTLQGVRVLDNCFVASYLRDARSALCIYAIDGRFQSELLLPGIGSVSGFDGRRKDTETFYTFSSFTTPPTVYRYDFKTATSTQFRKPKVGFNPANYETRQVFYRSKDGTQVPMFVVHKKGLLLDGNNPTLLYGYGGFNVSLTPSFAISRLVWMELGGVYAVPNLRGGGEYGEAWHQAGMKLKKQNVFDDFIAAAEWLQAYRYTNPRKLAIAGDSNGGLLVGACMTQRPDLFGAALPSVGVMDMLRFHKFTIGWAWSSDYGSPEDEQEFQALYAYSPLHNLRPGTAYPATLIATADRDDRVVPAHSFKYAAALQAAHIGDAPVLIRIETTAGHGAGKPTTKRIEEAADKMAFLVATLGVTVR
ncbi:serine protease of the peptidase family S9A [Rubidibacter lacunae KORDI 51-2]|uniref:prolyl oligopeptidase n=1 Tax=Rubidibacter lacunae KORDI 51-2 TaxID=582515 RepID=U5DN27_9CHRO|nr:prolyl oligopeptidase family serine peptidase [Rubidibacter lacunae]ERN42257.1 serine protease of the peptidase family S9A [Rubidibacter lacunae KORDI 51-2]